MEQQQTATPVPDTANLAPHPVPDLSMVTVPLLKGVLYQESDAALWNALLADWLRRCTVHYWGDIDTHGFAILDQLRRNFPHVNSLLMDRATLLTHRKQWGNEPKQTTNDLPYLDLEERNLYNDLRDNRIGICVRLEQEKIGYGWILDRLKGSQ
jgi:hypothetical protein